VKLKGDNLEAFELEKLRNMHQVRMQTLAEKFKERQTGEMHALLKRIQTGREEQKKQRQSDLERLLQRYQNVKSELESQQNIERMRADKFNKLNRTDHVSPEKSMHTR